MINVTCAVIRNDDDEVLVVQRGENTDHPFKWEFPGGKVHPGETEEDCIIREILEELSIDIVIFKRLPDVQYDYGFKKIRLIPFVCDTLDEFPFLSEHIGFKWLAPQELASVDFSEADIAVAEYYLANFVGEPDMLSMSTPDEAIETISDVELLVMINKMISLNQVDWIAASAAENPRIFQKLLEFSFSSDQKIAFHSSWVLSKVHDRKPEIFTPHLERIIKSLEGLENESAIRSFLRILSLTGNDILNSKNQGLLADYCFKSLNSTISAIAIKVYSMEILYKLSAQYPDLIPELGASINKAMDLQSAALTSRGRSILKKLYR